MSAMHLPLEIPHPGVCSAAGEADRWALGVCVFERASNTFLPPLRSAI